MSDDEDYNSEEDLDYVPSEGEQVSEEENSGDEEDLSVLQDGEGGELKPAPGKRKPTGKKKKAEITKRQRKGGIKLDESTQDPVSDEKEKELSEEEIKRKKELAEEIAKEEEKRRQEKAKKREDDLWNSFMSDVKKPTRPSNSVSTGSGLGVLSSAQVKPTTPQNKVTITKVFDFAGEEVKVTKEVDVNSKEAKAEMKKHDETEEDKVKIQNGSTLIPQIQQSSQPISLKRPATAAGGGGGGLGSVLNKIGKKSKMGTLEKSKLDWESFKSKEGIVDDLKIHNKGKQGYTERMAFLNRADQRQFEIERDLRLGTSSKR